MHVAYHKRRGANGERKVAPSVIAPTKVQPIVPTDSLNGDMKRYWAIRIFKCLRRLDMGFWRRREGVEPSVPHVEGQAGFENRSSGPVPRGPARQLWAEGTSRDPHALSRPSTRPGAPALPARANHYPHQVKRDSMTVVGVGPARSRPGRRRSVDRSRPSSIVPIGSGGRVCAWRFAQRPAARCS